MFFVYYCPLEAKLIFFSPSYFDCNNIPETILSNSSSSLARERECEVQYVSERVYHRQQQHQHKKKTSTGVSKHDPTVTLIFPLPSDDLDDEDAPC